MRTAQHPVTGILRRWSSSTVPGFEICYCDEVGFRGAQHYVFDAYTVTLVDRGTGWFKRGRTRTEGGPGIVTVSAPGDVIAAHSAAGTTTCRNLYLSPQLIGELLAEGGRCRVFDAPVATDIDPTVLRGLELATRNLAAADSHLARDSLLWCALRNFVAGCRIDDIRRSAPRERRAVRRTREVLLDRLAENLSLEDLASAACLNRFHLLRVFRQETGLTPHAYRLHARVGRARALLATGMNACEAAAATGFTDQAHFTRTFKHLVGLTPGRYAAAFAGEKVNFIQGAAAARLL